MGRECDSNPSRQTWSPRTDELDQACDTKILCEIRHTQLADNQRKEIESRPGKHIENQTDKKEGKYRVLALSNVAYNAD